PGLAPQQRGRMIAWFRPFVIVAIVLILATGIWQTMNNPFIEVDSWSTLQELKDSTYGFSLFVKHGFVLATFLLTLIVTFIYAPRLMATPVAQMTGGEQVVAGASALEGIIRWLSVLNLLACLGALIMATRMVWELH
ncbi:MAG: CopD family protein, partial [Dehalococcoidia bacterium]